MRFTAKDVYLVMGSDQPATATVQLVQPDQPNQTEDLDAQGRVQVSGFRLYHIVRLSTIGEGVVAIQFDRPGVRLYSFTFGG